MNGSLSHTKSLLLAGTPPRYDEVASTNLLADTKVSPSGVPVLNRWTPSEPLPAHTKEMVRSFAVHPTLAGLSWPRPMQDDPSCASVGVQVRTVLPDRV